MAGSWSFGPTRTNLTGAGTNPNFDEMYVRDRELGTTSSFAIGPRPQFYDTEPSISDGGQYVVFHAAGSTFRCRFDSDPFAECVPPKTPTPALPDGPHAFEVFAIDAAGNRDTSAARASFTVDATPPDTTFTEVPPALTNDNSPTFRFTANEANSTFECSVDTVDFAPCSSPLSPSLADGAHTVRVRATDGAVNLEEVPASRTFTVDTTPPDTTITSSPASQTNDNTPTITFEASEPNSTFECSASAIFIACTSPFTSGALPEGPNTFRVRAVHRAREHRPEPRKRNVQRRHDPAGGNDHRQPRHNQ